MDVKSELLHVVGCGHIIVEIGLYNVKSVELFYYVVIIYYCVGDMRWSRWNSGCTCFLLVN